MDPAKLTGMENCRKRYGNASDMLRDVQSHREEIVHQAKLIGMENCRRRYGNASDMIPDIKVPFGSARDNQIFHTGGKEMTW